MDIWSEQQRLTSILGAWAAGSVAKGAALMLVGTVTDRPFLVGFGRQSALWGAVDGVIATGGEFSRRRRLGWLADPNDPYVIEEERAKLDRILRINSALDVAYVLGGLGLVAASGRLGRDTPGRSATLAGDGAAIVLQGAFLLALDVNARARLA